MQPPTAWLEATHGTTVIRVALYGDVSEEQFAAEQEIAQRRAEQLGHVKRVPKEKAWTDWF